MEKIFRFFGKEYTSINQAALLLGVFAFLSQVLGLFRDRAIAHFIGPSPELDAYYAAFRIPDLIFISIASLASIAVLIPFITAKMDDGKVTDASRKFLSDVFTVFFTVMLLVSAFVFFLMPYLVEFVAPGFPESLQARVAELSRIMLLSPILLGLSNLLGSVTQIFRKFFMYALSPIFYNVGIICGILFLYPMFGIYGVAYGVILGAFFHFLIQFLASRGSGFKIMPTWKINFYDIKRAVLVSLPRTAGLSMNNIALIFIVAFASFFKAGSISIFNLSLNLQAVPLNIIGISYAVAAFPTLSRSFSGGKLDDFKAELRQAAKAIVFWSIPVTFLFIVLRAQIVRVILGSGSFSWENTRLVAASLAIFSVSILAQGMVALLSRANYAMGNTKRPLYINLASSALIIFLAYFFIELFARADLFRYFIESLLKVNDISGTEILMLPLAYATGTIVNFVLHWYFIRRDFLGHHAFITATFFQSLGASFFIGAVAYLSLNILSPIFGTITFFGVLFQGLFSGILGIAAGVLVLHLLRNEEQRELFRTLRTKFWRSKIIAPPQEEL